MALLKEYPGFVIEERYRPIPDGGVKVIAITCVLAALHFSCYSLCRKVFSDDVAILPGTALWLAGLGVFYRGNRARINAVVSRYFHANVIGYGLVLPTSGAADNQKRVLPLHKIPNTVGLFLPIGGWFARFCKGTAWSSYWRVRVRRNLDGLHNDVLVRLSDYAGYSLLLPSSEALQIIAKHCSLEDWFGEHQRMIKALDGAQTYEFRVLEAMVDLLRELRRTRQWIKSHECAKIFYRAVEELDRLASDRLREQARTWQRELAPGDKMYIGGVFMEIAPQDPKDPSPLPAEPLTADDAWDIHMRK